MKTVTYSVPNISCKHCVHTIKSEVGDIKGVLTVEADEQTKFVEISFEDPASTETIENLLAEIDYPVAK
jgi:copper chaperone CopZ